MFKPPYSVCFGLLFRICRKVANIIQRLSIFSQPVSPNVNTLRYWASFVKVKNPTLVHYCKLGFQQLFHECLSFIPVSHQDATALSHHASSVTSEWETSEFLSLSSGFSWPWPLKNTGRLFLRLFLHLTLPDVFSWETGFKSLLEEYHRVKAPFSLHRTGVDMRSARIITGDLDLDHLAKMASTRFLHCKIVVFPSSRIWKWVTKSTPHSRGKKLSPVSWQDGIST